MGRHISIQSLPATTAMKYTFQDSSPRLRSTRLTSARARTEYLLLLALILLAHAGVSLVNACTAIAVGPLATRDGGTINTHSDDCFDCDFRIARVPPAVHQLPSARNVPPMRYTYPRYVGRDRGATFFPEAVDKSIYNWSESLVVGTIPQVARTYSYIDGSYAIINEFGVSLGESTCGSMLVGKPVYDGGKALFEISELGRVALERSRTARECIQTIGYLAETYGLFSCEWTEERASAEGGEAYTIADEREVWVMHVSPDDTGASAVWVARRVPDNHVVVVANSFIIREIRKEDLENRPDEWMASKNIFEVAIRAKLWSGNEEVDGPLDWKKHYGWNFSPYRDSYVSRRVWRVLSTFAPSLALSPSSSSWDLPFSVPVEKPVTLEQIFALHRDHFEGTPYDTTKGLAAGPFGNPNRYDAFEGVNDPKLKSGAGLLLSEDALALESERGDKLVLDRSEGMPLTDEELATGHFERTISLFRTSYTAVSQMRFTETYHLYAPHLQSEGRYNASKDMYWIVNVPLGLPHQYPDLASRVKALNQTEYASEATGLIRSYKLATYGQRVLAKDVLSLELFPTDQVNRTRTLRPRLTAYRLFLAPHQTKTSVFFPIYPSAVDPEAPKHPVKPLEDESPLSDVPALLRTGSLYKFTAKSAWWIFCAVSNYAERAWRYIVRDIVKEQVEIEQQMLENTLPSVESRAEALIVTSDWQVKVLQASGDSDALEVSGKKKRQTVAAYSKSWRRASDLLNTYTADQTSHVVSRWWDLFWAIITRYHDGYRLDEPHSPDFTSTPLFYPTWWLKAIRWWRQPEGDPAQSIETDAEHWPSSDVCELPRALQTTEQKLIGYSSSKAPKKAAISEVIPSGSLVSANATSSSPAPDNDALLQKLGPIEVDRASPVVPGTVPEQSTGLGDKIKVVPSNRVQVTPAGAAKVAQLCAESNPSSGWTLVFVGIGSVAIFMSGYFLGTHSAEPLPPRGSESGSYHPYSGQRGGFGSLLDGHDTGDESGYERQSLRRNQQHAEEYDPILG